LKKNGKTLNVSIASGLDKNTDTAPQGVSRPTGTGGRGRGTTTGGRGGNTGGGNTQQNTQPNTGGGRGRAVIPPQTGRGGPPPPSNVPKAQAQYAYTGSTQDELTFNEGDIIIIHKKDPGGWWEGELNGKRGWIPANYVYEI